MPPSFDAFPNGTTPRVAYSEDALNTWDTSGNTRKIRFYPLKNPDGSIVPNAFVFATEDSGTAPNYDSNDVVGIIRNVQAAPSGAEIGLLNIDGTPFPDRLVFNAIQNTNGTKPNTVHNTDNLRIYNTGDQPLLISSITSSNPAFLIATSFTYPLTIAPGASQNVMLFYSPTHTGLNSATDSATLTINSNAIDSPVKTVQFQGIWQSYPVATPASVSTEPTLQQIIGAFGYTTNIANAGQSLNQAGAIQTAGEEVLSSYWQPGGYQSPDRRSPVGASFHAQGVSSTLYWFNQGSPTSYNTILSTAVNDAQSLLPLQNDTTFAAASGTFSTNNVFGFNIDKKESSDNTLNAHATTADQGHHLRFYPARDRSGNLIPNTWIMAMDYTSGSFNYNQNVYPDPEYSSRGSRSARWVGSSR